MMFFRATGYGRSELERAFGEYASAYGRERAIATLEASTGAKSVSEVPEERIVCGLVELICGYSFVGRSEPSKSQAIADSLAKVHAGLATIGEKAFARMRGEHSDVRS